MAAVQQVTEEDEELLLISAGGQVIRTETNTINRYGSGARGVIVMRLTEGDRWSASPPSGRDWRSSDGMEDNDGPDGGRATPGAESGSRVTVERTPVTPRP